LLTSRPPPIFEKNCESSGEERDLKKENLKVLQHATTVKEGFGKHCGV